MKLRISLIAWLLAATAFASETAPPDEWSTAAARAEIKPSFAFNPDGGPDHTGGFIIKSGPLARVEP